MDRLAYTVTDRHVGSGFEFELEIPPPAELKGQLSLENSPCLVSDSDTDQDKYDGRCAQCMAIYYRWVGTVIYFTGFILYSVYLGFSVNHDVKGSIFPLVVFALWILVIIKGTLKGLAKRVKIGVTKLVLFSKRHPKPATWTKR